MTAQDAGPEDHRHAAAWLGVPTNTPLTARVVAAITDPQPDLSSWSAEAVEALGGMTDNDCEQVLTFAAFLGAIAAPAAPSEEAE